MLQVRYSSSAPSHHFTHMLPHALSFRFQRHSRSRHRSPQFIFSHFFSARAPFFSSSCSSVWIDAATPKIRTLLHFRKWVLNNCGQPLPILNSRVTETASAAEASFFGGHKDSRVTKLQWWTKLFSLISTCSSTFCFLLESFCTTRYVYNVIM